MSSASTIFESLKEAQATLDKFLNDAEALKSIELAADSMVKAIHAGGKILSCGNGGSMCDAMHFAEELTGRFRDDRRPLPAIAIADPGHITCVANDYGFQEIFSRYISAVGRKGDVLLAISTSGNSPNILAAVRVARELGMTVVGLTGKGGGKLRPLSDIVIDVAHEGYSDRIQEVHIKVIHILIQLIETKT